MSEPGLTNQWEPWQRLIDSIGPHYRSLFAARDRASGEQCDLDEEQLGTITAEGRGVAGSLDQEGARLTVAMTADQEWHSRLAANRAARSPSFYVAASRGSLAPRRRRHARADAAE